MCHCLAWSPGTSATGGGYSAPFNRFAGTSCFAGAQGWLEDHSSGDGPTLHLLNMFSSMCHVEHTAGLACSQTANVGTLKRSKYLLTV